MWVRFADPVADAAHTAVPAWHEGQWCSTRRLRIRPAAYAARVYAHCLKGDMPPMNVCVCVHEVCDIVCIAV